MSSALLFLPEVLGYGLDNIFNINLGIGILLITSFYIIIVRKLKKQNPAFQKVRLFINSKKFTQEELNIYTKVNEITLNTIIAIGVIGLLSIAFLVNNTSNNWPLQEPINIEQAIQQGADIAYYIGLYFFITFSFLLVIFLTAIILPYSILLWDKNFLIFLREGKYKDLKAGKAQLEE